MLRTIHKEYTDGPTLCLCSLGSGIPLSLNSSDWAVHNGPPASVEMMGRQPAAMLETARCSRSHRGLSTLAAFLATLHAAAKLRWADRSAHPSRSRRRNSACDPDRSLSLQRRRCLLSSTPRRKCDANHTRLGKSPMSCEFQESERLSSIYSSGPTYPGN